MEWGSPFHHEGDDDGSQTALQEIKPFLALYKSIELRQRAGIRTFLPRTLSYRAASAQASRHTGRNVKSKNPLKRLRQEEHPQAKKRKGRLGVVLSEEKLSRNERFLVVRLVGAFRDSLEIPQECSIKYACVYISLFANSDMSLYRLIESYQVVVPFCVDQDDTPAVDIPLEFDFVHRKASESFSLCFHVYPLNETAVDALETAQVVKSDGCLLEECIYCSERRLSFRKSFFFLVGMDDFPLQAPHTLLEPFDRAVCATDQSDTLWLSSPSRTTSPMKRAKGASSKCSLKFWDCETRAVRKGLIKTEVVSVQLEWMRQRLTSPAMTKCLHRKSSTVRSGPSRESALPRKRLPPRPVPGAREPQEILPVTIRWQVNQDRVEERLREYRCPICWMFCGSWDGVVRHGSACHQHFRWTRHIERQTVHVTLRTGNSLATAMASSVPARKGAGKERLKAQWEWIVTAPLHLDTPLVRRFVNTSDAFSLYADIDACEDRASMIDDSWLNVQDALSIEDFAALSVEEKRVMKMWNTFIRAQFPFPRRRIELGRETVEKFVRSNAAILKNEGLVTNIGLLLINLFDFGLITNDDVLAILRTLNQTIENM